MDVNTLIDPCNDRAIAQDAVVINCGKAPGCVPFGGVLLKGVKDLSVLAELTDEALLSTQAAAEHVRAGELDHFGQKGRQFTVNHLEEEEENNTGVNPVVSERSQCSETNQTLQLDLQ